MKKIAAIFSVLLFTFLLYPGTAMAQQNAISKKEQRKLEKEKKKKEKQAAELAERELTRKMLENRKFVFMANTLATDGGKTFSVTPKFNFLMINGDEVVFQFAFDGVVGWNGIGGFTLEGKIVDYKFEPGKNINKPMRVNARVDASALWERPYFTITIFDEGYASITMTVKGAAINMNGQIVGLENSGVYKGQKIFIDQ